MLEILALPSPESLPFWSTETPGKLVTGTQTNPNILYKAITVYWNLSKKLSDDCKRPNSLGLSRQMFHPPDKEAGPALGGHMALSWQVLWPLTRCLHPTKIQGCTPSTSLCQKVPFTIYFVTRRTGDSDETPLSPQITKARSLQKASGLGVLGWCKMMTRWTKQKL